MINEKQVLSKVLEEGQSQGSIGMSLDMDSAQVLMQMLSKNLYSDPIGSTVRECASNALDSHRKATVAEAIVVSLKVNAQNNYEFSVEDFGIGLDANDVENIISKYGKSTKRESNEFIGMMGLGFKAPLAYSSSFYFVCRKDGIERKYMMYEGEDENTIDQLYETPTTERNGVKVIVPVKYEDRHTFRKKIGEQLAYFESVYFDVNVENSIITNEFQIHRSQHFQISELNSDSNVHICLDNVYYPLDYSKLGISQIPVSIGLRFNLSDGLFPIPSREQLIYSTKAKEIILAKLEIVSNFLVEKYNETNVDCKDIYEIFNYYSSEIRNVTFGKIVIDAGKFSRASKIDFKQPTYSKYTVTDFQLLYNHKEYLFYEYKVNMEFIRGQFRQNRNNYRHSLSFNNVKQDKQIFSYEELFVGNKKSYIKSLLPLNDWNGVKFVKKVNKFTLKNHKTNHLMDNYYEVLNLKKHPKSTWRAKIREFQNIIGELASKFQHVDDIAIPQSWLDAKKKKRVSIGTGTGVKRVKLQGEINCRKAEELQRFVADKSSKLTPTVLKVAEIESSKVLHVYGRQKDETLVDQLYSVSSKQKINYLILSEREHKVAETLDLHNFISIDKFMEGKNKPFKRIITGYLIYSLIQKYNNTFGKANLIQPVSNTLYERLQLLIDYSNKNYHRIGDEDIYKAMLVVSEEHKLFDETIYTEYCELKELLDGFPFIDATMDMLKPDYNGNLDKRYIDVLIDLFKYNRIRIDYTNYKLTLNSDVTEPITDELIEQLTQNN